LFSQEVQTAPEGEGEAKPDEVRQVQLGLVKLGYELGPIDGILGPRTRAAIRTYQQDHNLTVDGKISTGLMQSLASSSAR
jgi:peptidoglycan hydrolase-like protein with peptidoglycan-binding domain